MLEAGTWRSAFIAAATDWQLVLPPATDWQLVPIRAATPGDDAEPIRKPVSVIAFVPVLNGLGGR